jgi:hypothetical protein
MTPCGSKNAMAIVTNDLVDRNKNEKKLKTFNTL